MKRIGGILLAVVSYSALALVILLAVAILTSNWWGQWVTDPAWRACLVSSDCGVGW